MIKYLIILLILIANVAHSALPFDKQNIFAKLPEGSKIIITLSLEDKVITLYGQIEKDLIDINYLVCYDPEADMDRIIYPDENEIVDIYIQGNKI